MKEYTAKRFVMCMFGFLIGFCTGVFLVNLAHHLDYSKPELEELEKLYKKWKEMKQPDLFACYQQFFQEANPRRESKSYLTDKNKRVQDEAVEAFWRFFENGVEPIHAIYNYQDAWFEAIAQLDCMSQPGRWVLTKNGYIIRIVAGRITNCFIAMDPRENRKIRQTNKNK